MRYSPDYCLQIIQILKFGDQKEAIEKAALYITNPEISWLTQTENLSIFLFKSTNVAWLYTKRLLKIEIVKELRVFTFWSSRSYKKLIECIKEVL